jgi:c-di-GMP-binding flagellar brake protein YcgR
MDTGKKTADSHVVDCQWSEAERRAYERHAARSYVRVIDVHSGATMGEIVDISAGGFKLAAHRQFRLDGVYEFRIDVRVDGKDREPITAVARNVWSTAASGSDDFQAGFMFVSLSALSRARLQEFIDELSA